MKKMFGVITAMTTPFDANDKVDVKALEEQVEFDISKGVDCLYPCGTTGEMFNMTPEERELAAETVLRAAAGRATVFIHVGAMTLKETVRLARHAEKIGADGIGVVTPAFFGVKDKAMLQYYQKVSASVSKNFPIYLYSIPQCAANDLKPSLVAELIETCPNIVGIKYSYSDMIRLKDYLNLNNGNFSVLFGADRLFLPALTMGCEGTVSGCSGPMPEHFVNIYKAYREGDMKKALQEQKIANEICEIMQSGADMGIFKAVLQFRGLAGGHMRAPLIDLDEAEKKELYARITPYLEK
ncbi:dihydrodipicolinate synthase family protein [Caproiciproducens sp. NJN-50]|uniref:dihydrodipicolinate synthase family protein n=1 Tax=Acutalibacteraceae TaxID=3082771 RepID=UPI000FFE2042|nr:MULTISPECIES: dihydrodipicolinate synthase family protein [Acutalibacteraceae]QAT50041.1 dihydrodipicolinate synthase family protein [Caproiciproducens sp. NJN-50]